MSDMLPLILLSGMGADERVFTPQLEAFPQARVARWLTPLKDESLPAYARRMAEAVDPKSPCFIGGASFGGFVAVEMARHLQTIACFLIGSVTSPAHLPRRVRMARRGRKVLPLLPIGLTCRMAGIGVKTFGELSTLTKTLMQQIADSDAEFLRWGTEAVLMWEQTDAPAVTIYRIHGDRDRVLPIGISKADRVVAGGGHVISLTHAHEVNEFLSTHMNRLREGAFDPAIAAGPPGI